MSDTIRLEFVTKDRVGMVLDLLKVLYCYDINVQAMEVWPERVYLKLDKSNKVSQELLNRLHSEEDVLAIREIDLLPQEKREKHAAAVLDAASDGIIAVDCDGVITTFNRAAGQITNIKTENAIGNSIADCLSPDVPVLKTIVTGESYDNVEIILKNDNNRSHYITSGRPILDGAGKPIGAVTSLQAIENVMKLVYSVNTPLMITFDEIVGRSENFIRVKKLAGIVARGDATVLICGESGTGKELFARAIHMASPRRDKRFVPINCASLPDALLESELFGYEAGSFTGAKKSGKQGLFKYADQGTIFLDEIGELSLHLQVKLLRVLQEGKIRRVGAEEEVAVDVRVIAATNRNLEEMIRKGQFREDLYYRLAVFPLSLPPLRERKEDIAILADNFIEKLSKKMKKSSKGITLRALEKLTQYNWPGNVRELANVIERALYLCSDTIDDSHLILSEAEFSDLSQLTPDIPVNETKTLKALVTNTEKQAIVDAVRHYGSIRKAARALEVSHATVLNKIKAYSIVLE